MTTQQPETTPSCEALRLADAMERFTKSSHWWTDGEPIHIAVAAELRSLHTENETLRAGYAAARQEIASLQAQLEAVGAGGVEPLRKRCLHQISEPAQLVGAEPVAWQPIATAPRDGTNILIRFGSDGDSQAKYIPGLTHPWKFIDTNDGITWLINHAVDGPGGPSHWMQFPPYRKAAAPQPAAQDAPVDAAVQEDAERWQFFAEYLVGPRTDLDDEIVGCDSVQKMAGVIDAAIAAQKETND